MKIRGVATSSYKTRKTASNKPKNVLFFFGKTASRNAKIALKAMLMSRLFNYSFKLSLIGMITFSALYGAYALIGTNVAKDIIVSKSEIISRVGLLTDLPKANPEAVVRVEDPSTLRKQNPFYDSVKEGDYILIYKDLAVIYDLRNNVIVGLKRAR